MQILGLIAGSFNSVSLTFIIVRIRFMPSKVGYDCVTFNGAEVARITKNAAVRKVMLSFIMNNERAFQMTIRLARFQQCRQQTSDD